MQAQKTSLEVMNNWLQKRDFFSLKTALAMPNDLITKQDSLYFQASVQNAFGKNKSSIATIKQLSDKYASQIEDDAWINLLSILADDYTKIYDYHSAEAIYAILLTKYGAKLNKDDYDSYENNYSLYKSLAKVPVQTVRFLDKEPILLSRDQQDLWNIPVVINQKDSARFIFDSGAGLSTITESAARRLGVQIIPANVKINSANDKQLLAQVGVASEIKIGGAIFNNVVFLVIADEFLQFPSINYRIEGIVGFPVINAMQNITITKNGSLYIHSNTHGSSDVVNFYYQGNAMKLLGRSSGDTLFFHLDTGAKQSELNKEYYDAHRSLVRAVSEKKKYHLGGAGGVTTYKTYQLPNFPIKIGSRERMLPFIPVYPDKVSPYGNAIGQDYIGLFNQMEIDFKNCYIDFK